MVLQKNNKINNNIIMLNGLFIDEYGCHRYYKNDKIHRDEGPAIILPAGSVKYFINGQLHNENGPATVSGKKNILSMGKDIEKMVLPL